MSPGPARDQNLGLLRRLYDGLESGDFELIGPLLAGSVVVRLSGAGDLDGTYRGGPAAERLYRTLLRRLGRGFMVPPHDVLVHDASLVVVPSGTTFGTADRGMDVYHFEDGLITEIWLTAWRAPADDSRPIGGGGAPAPE